MKKKIPDMIESQKDGILQEDLNAIANVGLPFEQMKKAGVLVTGATGLVGSMVIKALACCNRIHDLNMTIFALVRNERKARGVLGELIDREDIRLVKGDILEKLRVEEPIDFVIHGASVTASKTFVTKPVETIRTAIDGTVHVLELAREKQVKGMVYISSMEAFGITDPSLSSVKEADLGYIDVMNAGLFYFQNALGGAAK